MVHRYSSPRPAVWWWTAAAVLLAPPPAGGQVDVPCEALVGWLGCDGQLPGGAAANAATVRAACATECPTDSRCAPGKTPVAANVSANISASCQSCAPGMYSRVGANCEACPPGKHQDTAGADRCFDCPVGRYEARHGQAECTQCPAHASTCKLVVHEEFGGLQERCESGAVSGDSCACRPGFLEQSSGVCEECPFGGVCCMCKDIAGCYDSAFGACDFDALMHNFREHGTACAGEGSCFSGTTVALPRPGYEYDVLVAGVASDSFELDGDGDHWAAASVNQSGGLLVACNTMAAGRYKDTRQNSFDKQNCLGGPNNTCAKGHSGRMCAICDEDWYLTRQGHCEKCVNRQRSRIVVLTIGITVIFFAAPLSWGVLYWMVADKDSSQFLVYFRLLIDHFQLLSINTGIRAAWPWELQTIYRASESAGLNLDFLEMECAFGWKYEAKYNIFLSLPVFFFGEILLITSAVRLICWYRIRAVERYVQRMQAIAQDEDTVQTLSEQKSRTITAAFDELDPEGDGFITVDKLPELGRMCGLSLDAAIEVRNTLHYIDPQGSGRITKETWVSFVAVSLHGLTQPPQPNEATAVEESQKKDPLGTRVATFVCRIFADLHVRTEGLIPLVPETTDDWEKVKDHAIQIFLMLMMMAYITLAKWGISVFDCFEQPNKPGTFNLDDAPYIQCFTSEWYRLSALGGMAILLYVIGLPIAITYIFFANYVRLRMGDMQCMQRYGFLYKPYRPGSPGWEVVILVRKSLLVLLTKLRSQSPYMQGVWSLLVYAVVIMTQSRVAPYRQLRHTNMANYFISVNALAVFSSLIFTSNIPTKEQQTALLHINLVCMISGWIYACYATLIDLYLYLRKNMYVEYALTKNQVDPTIDRHYQGVDTNGVIDMSFYDLLVLRARYSHAITRDLPAEDDDSSSSSSGTGTGTGSGLPKPAQPRQVVENQTKAHERFDDFNRMFADFVRRVDPTAVLPKPRAAAMRDDGSSGDASAVDEDSVLKSPLESPFMLTEFKARAKMLEELYSTNHLTLMVCFYDFVIKHDLVKPTGLAEFGAPEVAEDIIHFLNTFTTDAILHAGGRPWGRANDDDHETVRSSQRPKDPDVLQVGDGGGGGGGGGGSDEDDAAPKQQLPMSMMSQRSMASTVEDEVQLAKAMRNGRRFLLNCNRLLGNNMRQFLTDRQVDWLSLDDVLDVLQQEIEEQAKQLQRAIAKDPLIVPSEPELVKPSKPGEDERAPWVASERTKIPLRPSEVRKGQTQSKLRGSRGDGAAIAVSNPLHAVDEDDEDEDEDDE